MDAVEWLTDVACIRPPITHGFLDMASENEVVPLTPIQMAKESQTTYKYQSKFGECRASLTAVLRRISAERSSCQQREIA